MAKKKQSRTRAEAEQHPVARDIGQLSSGTIASLTGERDYETIDLIRDNFRIFTVAVLMGGTDFKNWQEAWKYYEAQGKKQSGRLSGNEPKTKRIGYIYLTLRKDTPTGWILDVERIDPYGGTPFKQDYWFEDEDLAVFWFNEIQGNEDIVALHQESDLPPIEQYELPGSIWW